MDGPIGPVIGANVTIDEACADPAQTAATARTKSFQNDRIGMLHCISTPVPYQSRVDAGLKRWAAF
jgi:hypothetical protein